MGRRGGPGPAHRQRRLVVEREGAPGGDAAIVWPRSRGAVRARPAPRYLFSGLLTCGACGGGYTLVGARHYGCANARNRGTCDNRLTIRRDVWRRPCCGA